MTRDLRMETIAEMTLFDTGCMRKLEQQNAFPELSRLEIGMTLKHGISPLLGSTTLEVMWKSSEIVSGRRLNKPD